MKIRLLGAWMGCVVAVASAGCVGSGLEAPHNAPTDVTPDGVPPEDGVSDDVADVGDTDPADGSQEIVEDIGPDIVVPDPDWEAVSLGDLGSVGGLSVVSGDEAYAGSGARALRFNGITWAAFGTPDEARVLHGIWSDGSTVVAVGAGGLVARRAAGPTGVWVIEPSGVTADLWAVAGRGPDDLVAVGDDGVVLRFDGETWEKRHERTSMRLRGVAIAPDSEGDAGIRAVGSGGQLVEMVGSTWRGTQIAASASTLSGFAHLADGTLVAVGTQHTLTARRPNAPAWQGETTNDSRQRDAHAVTVGADGVVRAFGAQGLVVKREGISWSVDTGPGNVVGVKNFGAVGGFGTGTSAGLIAVAREGGGVQLRNGSWSAISTALDATVLDLEADTTGRIWAAATRGILLVQTDSDWTVVPLPFQTELTGLAADDDGGMWVVGAGGRVLHVSKSFEINVVALPVPVDLQGVVRVGARVFACGRGGTLFDIDTSGAGAPTVAVRSTGTVADLRAVAVEGTTLWVGGAFGTLLKGPIAAGALVQVDTATGGSVNEIVVFDGDVFAAGDNGVILKVRGDTVTLENEAPGVFLYGMAVTADGAVAAGSGGVILRRSGGATPTWVAEQAATPSATFEAVHIDTEGQAWVGSNRREASLERRLEALSAGEMP